MACGTPDGRGGTCDDGCDWETPDWEPCEQDDS